jgi:hypothetical protein
MRPGLCHGHGLGEAFDGNWLAVGDVNDTALHEVADFGVRGHRPSGGRPPRATGDWLLVLRRSNGSGKPARLDAHGEVGICFRYIERLDKPKRQIQRMTRHAPSGPSWRRFNTGPGSTLSCG